MDKELFEGCIVKFNSIIDKCHLMLDNVVSKNDILKMSLADIQKLKQFCTEEQSKQDKIFSEVRHLLGMGNLSPIQTSKLIKCFKEYSIFRSDIKTIAMHLNSITDLPGLPSKAEFKLEILGNFKLTSELRGGKEEESVTMKETVSDTVEPTPVASEDLFRINNLSLLPTYKNGLAIKYRKKDITELATLLIASKVTAKSRSNVCDMLSSENKEIKTAQLYTIVEKVDDDYYLYFPYKTDGNAARAKQHLFDYLSIKKLK